MTLALLGRVAVRALSHIPSGGSWRGRRLRRTLAFLPRPRTSAGSSCSLMPSGNERILSAILPAASSGADWVSFSICELLGGSGQGYWWRTIRGVPSATQHEVDKGQTDIPLGVYRPVSAGGRTMWAIRDTGGAGVLGRVLG